MRLMDDYKYAYEVRFAVYRTQRSARYTTIHRQVRVVKLYSTNQMSRSEIEQLVKSANKKSKKVEILCIEEVAL